jgi:transposase
LRYRRSVFSAIRDPRVKASEKDIARSLEGNWQEDLLFVLKQEQAAFEFCRKQMAECDRQLEQYLQKMEDRSQGATPPEQKRKDRLQKKKGNQPEFRLATAVVSHDGHRPNSDRWY